MKIQTENLIRQAVADALAARGLTTYQASLLLADIVSRTHLYDWLRGTYRLSDDKASLILARLSLKITTKHTKSTKKKTKN